MIERLATLLPLPIKFDSRRRHIQRFLLLPKLSVPLIWFPIIKYIIRAYFPKSEPLIVALDRTKWKQNNLLVGSVIWSKRAWPIYWNFMEGEGNSTLSEQKSILRPIIRLLKSYNIIIVGDREFHSIKLANWLDKKKVGFALRQKKDTYIKQKRRDYQRLDSLSIKPGVKLYIDGVMVGKEKGFGRYDIAVRWKRKYRNKSQSEPWYILTNLGSLRLALKAYKARWGIEAMFKDCKTGGYNLESCKANKERLTRLMLLIAIAYTWASLKGQKMRLGRQNKYVCRLTELERLQKRHSNFWVGSYGMLWIAALEFFSDFIPILMNLNPHKQQNYQRGLTAASLIQLSL